MKIFVWIVLGVIALGTIYLAADIASHKIKEKLTKNKEKSQKNQ